MLIVEFLLSLIFLALLIALPFIFKSIFKTQNYMGYSIGLFASALTIAALIGVVLIGYILLFLVVGISFSLNSGIVFSAGIIIVISVFILVIYVVIFLFIFFYTKGISNPNQPYNSVFMFIAGYLLPPFALIYLLLILNSLADQGNYNNGAWRYSLGFFILGEFFFLLNEMQIAGTIMLSMLHHRKVNKSILGILLVCHFLPAFSFLIGFFSGDQYLSFIPNMVLNLISFGFGVFFYRKYASQDYPKSEILNPSDM
jgi:hypothetical protein